MSFFYDPMTEEEIQSLRLLPEGEYDFEVAKAEFKMSKPTEKNPQGVPMINLTLKMWDIQGKEHLVFDRLMSLKSVMYKTKHFCDSVGLSKEYSEGRFNESLCENARGKAHIIIEPPQKKEGGGFYPEKNAVRDYVASDQQNKKVDSVPKTETALPFSDDIPF